MSEQPSIQDAGWSIGESITLELDVVLSIARGQHHFVSLPASLAALEKSLPPDIPAELQDMFDPSLRINTLLEYAAYLAGVLLCADYRAATVPMRELDSATALGNLAGIAAPLGLVPDGALPVDECLLELWERVSAAGYARLGIEAEAHERYAGRTRVEMTQMLRILHDGDLHARFWHWLDRFYYEHYRPWREMQTVRLDAIRKRAVAVMGQQDAGQPPALQWLPKQNPIHMHPTVEAYILAGQLQLFLWVEPFELPDTWSLYPGLILASFAEPGPLWESFEASATDVAQRAKALADPTRLIILRLIRHFSLINTDLADYLGLARPTVSVHAKILREAGLIRSHQEGRRVRHEIVPEEVHRLFRDMQDFLDLPHEG